MVKWPSWLRGSAVAVKVAPVCRSASCPCVRRLGDGELRAFVLLVRVVVGLPKHEPAAAVRAVQDPQVALVVTDGLTDADYDWLAGSEVTVFPRTACVLGSPPVGA